MTYKTFLLDIDDKIAHVRLNRPQKANALDATAWEEMQTIFRTLDQDPAVRVIILSGEGKHFCAGIDLSQLMAIRQASADADEGRQREKIHHFAQQLQAPINAIETCRKPVLAAIHNACVGAGVDVITACDMRYATQAAYFAIAEIDMGMVADLGTLQRLPKLIGAGMTRELAFTGRRFSAEEALNHHLINQLYADKAEMLTAVTALAKTIASKSPLSIRGTKQVLNFSREHSIADGLAYVATWNAGMILSNDLTEAFTAYIEKRPPHFAD